LRAGSGPQAKLSGPQPPYQELRFFQNNIPVSPTSEEHLRRFWAEDVFELRCNITTDMLLFGQRKNFKNQTGMVGAMENLFVCQ